MSDFLLKFAAFLAVIGPVIFVHELGHFLVAKGFGMRVLAFSMGFGKRLWGFKRGETEYQLALLPIGGYVKLSGEEAEEQPTDDPRDFLNRPRWQRIAVYLAGPAMNGVFSILVIAGLFVVGVEVPFLQGIPSTVGAVDVDSPAAKAGLAAGDRIVAVGGKATERWGDVAIAIVTSGGKPVAIDYERGGERRSTEVVPIQTPGSEFAEAGIYPQLLPRIGSVNAGSPAEAAGLQKGDIVRAVDGQPIFGTIDFITAIEARPERETRLELTRGAEQVALTVVPRAVDGKGKIGVALVYERKYPPLQALVESVKFNWETLDQTLSLLGRIFTRDVSAKNTLSGPLGIADQSGEVAKRSAKEFLYWMAMISLSIGMLNLFPIPILDGGQITVLLIESVARRDLSMGIKLRIAQVGFALIVMLMVTVLYFDISKIVGRWLGG